MRIVLYMILFICKFLSEHILMYRHNANMACVHAHTMSAHVYVMYE